MFERASKFLRGMWLQLAAMMAVWTILAVPAFMAKTSAQPLKVDRNIPRYEPVRGVSGHVRSVGSDSMHGEILLWAETFNTIYPKVSIQIEGKGSSTAPPALVEGRAHLAPMSRPMLSEEIETFEEKFGYPPTAVRTSLGVLAVYVHWDNPIESLTLPQLDAIFSKTRRSGYAKDIKTWGDLGLEGEWAEKPINLYGRNAASGTHAYFKEHVLFAGDYKDCVKEQADSDAVIRAIGSEKFAIGYSGIVYKTADVRAVPLRTSESTRAVVPSMDNSIPNMDNGYRARYPLSRYLYVYVNKAPNRALDPLRLEFLKFVLSYEGQEDVLRDGYVPLPLKIVLEERKNIGVAD